MTNKSVISSYGVNKTPMYPSNNNIYIIMMIFTYISYPKISICKYIHNMIMSLSGGPS